MYFTLGDKVFQRQELQKRNKKRKPERERERRVPVERISIKY